MDGTAPAALASLHWKDSASDESLLTHVLIIIMELFCPVTPNTVAYPP